MENNSSLLTRFTTVAGEIGSVLNRLDVDGLDRAQIRLVGTIKRLAADTRLDIRDWEMSETRSEMQTNGRQALGRLEQTREAILLASEHNLFSAIEVAEVSAHFDRFAAELRQ